MDNFDDYYDDGLDMNEHGLYFDLQKEMTEAYAKIYETSKKNYSPTMGAGICERKTVLKMLPHQTDWDAWGTVNVTIGNAIEDMLTKFIFKDAKNAKLIHNGLWLNNKELEVKSQADYLMMIRSGNENFRLVVGEAKSGKDLPFNPSPKKLTGDFFTDNAEKLEQIEAEKYEYLYQMMFYQAYLGVDGVIMFVSKDAQKGNGMANSPKYLNAFSAINFFDEERILELVSRIFFSRASFSKNVIPPTPDRFKPPQGKKTPHKACAFCDFKGNCFGNWELKTGNFTEMKEETIDPLWEWSLNEAKKFMSPDKLSKRRYEIYMKLVNNTKDPQRVQEATRTFIKEINNFDKFNALFEYEGYVGE